MLDTDPEHTSAQPENAVILPKWKGDPQDKNLVAMIPFLECTSAPPFIQSWILIFSFITAIAIYKPNDVRPILTAYQGKDIPLEWGKKEAEMKAKHVAEWQAKNKHKVSAGSGWSFGSMLGLSDPVRILPLEEVRKTDFADIIFLFTIRPHLCSPRTNLLQPT